MAVTPRDRVQKELTLVWGVYPLLSKSKNFTFDDTKIIEALMKNVGYRDDNDKVKG